MLWRILLSAALLGAWVWIGAAFGLAVAPAMNEAGAGQFNGGDAWRQAVAAQGTWTFVYRAGAVSLIAVLACIWWAPLKRLMLGKDGGALLLFVAGVGALAFSAAPAHAYRYKTDYAEYYNAKPDETVFLVPMLGDAGKQSVKKDAEFLETKKVPAQFVLITHGTLPGTGTFMNDVVNTAQAVVVKRRPVAREWTHRADTGTSSADQSFSCESAESHNIRTAITAAFMIEEGNAATYLYFAGADPTQKLPTSQSGGESDKDPTFVSAVAAMSLSDFVDTFGRRIIQTELCKAIGARATDRVIAEKAKIIEEVNAAATTQLKAMGVTVKALGYGGPLDLDGDIQSAINNVYIQGKRKLAVDAIKDVLPAMEQQARVEALLAFSEALKSGKLPNLPSFVGAIPPEILEGFKHYVMSATPAGLPPVK